ncbi:hypothetical protein [Galbitalea soli]|uniref:Uncharacterized protein n=1 Tax=Galbitalea soli TaxID=1268042 RepID=A0A7C9TQS8_9MICO|nr:hypothetical protein [Galbitalea soli]NYJ30087.1 hypothetical protein [Galbitalea soli]
MAEDARRSLGLEILDSQQHPRLPRYARETAAGQNQCTICHASTVSRAAFGQLAYCHVATWSLTRFPGRFLCVDHAAISVAV